MKVSDCRAQAVACSSLRFVPLLLSKVLIAQKNCHNNLQRIACHGVIPPYIESPSLATCCMNKPNKLQCTSCTALIWGTCKQPVYTTINTYRIVGNFRGRKLSRISWFYGYSQKCSPWHSLVRQKWAIHESFLSKIVYFHNSRKLSPLKVSHYTVYNIHLYMYIP